MLQKAFALYDVPTMKIELPVLFAEGPHVCVLFRLDARTARGAHHTADYLAHFEVEKGRIRSVREFFDIYTVQGTSAFRRDLARGNAEKAARSRAARSGAAGAAGP
jgi:ketosteroid isomerase-like protein